MPGLQKKKTPVEGVFPAAAAAPTNPSFRDTPQKNQWAEFSRKFCRKLEPESASQIERQ
jgi:hypothetical protein